MGKSFNEYVNGLRVEDFKRKSLDPSYRHVTLLSIAYESGFNSKSVFNGFFKSTEGMTPSAWVKAHTT
jgi:AraC-like DNA-binding protein